VATVRRIFRAIPRPPRCVSCNAPFQGPLQPLLRLIGKVPFAKNPRYCRGCYSWLLAARGGAEVVLSMLFADVRGSTPLAEQLGPAALHSVMDHVSSVGVDVLTRSDAILERFVGDQVAGYFVPMYAGAQHARRAVDAGLELLAATGNIEGATPSVPVGIHTGLAYFGTVGTEGDVLELTALGSEVVVAARLADIAAAGELLVTEDAYRAAALDVPAERRELQLKGVSAPVAVRVLHATAREAAAAR